jgi:CMP-N-acetylneuraminate monooxygenase
MKNVRAVPFERWLTLGPNLRAMLLRDGTAPGDSGMLLEYAGHRILNAVDCSDLASGLLPERVDLMLSSFSRGASGFPVCWDRLFSREAMLAWIEKDAANVVRRLCDTVARVKPRFFLPFASFFVEAHPADAALRELNVKTSPEVLCHALARACPEAATIAPRPGDCIDLADLSVSRGPEARPPAYDFERFLAPVEACRRFAPLEHAKGVLRYFEWSGYRGDLILHLIETDDAFEPCGRSWLLDLSGPRLLQARPAAAHRYLRIDVRGDVFRHTLRYGLPWEEISIGFNARMYREPNAYNRDFWVHFQNCLPPVPPWGEAD